MVAYSFKAQFADAIRSGRKSQTIRNPRIGRSRHARPGEELQLYTAMRTKHCALIGRAVCREAWPIVIAFSPAAVSIGAGAILPSAKNLDLFARLDGFDDWLGMRDFWRQTHALDVFRGVIIYWKEFEATA